MSISHHNNHHNYRHDEAARHDKSRHEAIDVLLAEFIDAGGLDEFGVG